MRLFLENISPLIKRMDVYTKTNIISAKDKSYMRRNGITEEEETSRSKSSVGNNVKAAKNTLLGIAESITPLSSSKYFIFRSVNSGG